MLILQVGKTEPAESNGTTRGLFILIAPATARKNIGIF
jgi:hypothetical protein